MQCHLPRSVVLTLWSCCRHHSHAMRGHSRGSRGWLPREGQWLSHSAKATHPTQGLSWAPRRHANPSCSWGGSTSKALQCIHGVCGNTRAQCLEKRNPNWVISQVNGSQNIEDPLPLMCLTHSNSQTSRSPKGLKLPKLSGAKTWNCWNMRLRTIEHAPHFSPACVSVLIWITTEPCAQLH